MGPIGGLQQGLEILFAADVYQTAFRIHQSLLYTIFGDYLFEIIDSLNAI